MSDEIIRKIKGYEAEADRIRNEAKDEAKSRIARAEAEGKELLEKTENDAVRINGAKLDLTKSKASELLSHATASAEANAKDVCKKAEFNMREAVRFIISGVKEQCQ